MQQQHQHQQQVERQLARARGCGSQQGDRWHLDGAVSFVFAEEDPLSSKRGPIYCLSVLACIQFVHRQQLEGLLSVLLLMAGAEGAADKLGESAVQRHLPPLEA